MTTLPVTTFTSIAATLPPQLANLNLTIPPIVSAYVVDSAIATTWLGSGAAASGAIGAMQGAALLLSACSKKSTKNVFVFYEIEGVSNAGGWLFMVLLSTAVLTFHFLLAVILACYWRFCKKIHPPNFEAHPDEIQEEEGATTNDPVTHTNSLPPFSRYMFESKAKVAFPHYTLMVFQISFVGICAESATLTNDPDSGMASIGYAGIIMCLMYVAYIAYTFFLYLRPGPMELFERDTDELLQQQVDEEEEAEGHKEEEMGEKRAEARHPDAPVITADNDGDNHDEMTTQKEEEQKKKKEGDIVVVPVGDKQQLDQEAQKDADLEKARKEKMSHWPAPYFVKFTDEFVKKDVSVYTRFFMPLGVWNEDRHFVRRHNSLFGTFKPDSALIMPVLQIFYTFIISVVPAQSECNVPPAVWGVTNTLFALLVLWWRPTRYVLDDFFLFFSYIGAGLVAFTQQWAPDESEALFMITFSMMIVQSVHQFVTMLVEDYVWGPREMERFPPHHAGHADGEEEVKKIKVLQS